MKTEQTPEANVGKYDTDIENARTLIDSTRIGMLSTYWEVGRIAAEACEGCDKKDHRGVINDVAGDMGLTQETVACSLKIYEAYPTQEALEKVAEKGLSAGHVKALVHAVANPETRERLENRVQRQRYGVDEFTKMVKREVAASKKPAKKERPTPMEVFLYLRGRARNLLKRLRRDLEYAVADLERMQVGEDKANTAGAKQDAFEELQKLGKELIFFAKRVPGLQWWESPTPSKTPNENGG